MKDHSKPTATVNCSVLHKQGEFDTFTNGKWIVHLLVVGDLKFLILSSLIKTWYRGIDIDTYTEYYEQLMCIINRPSNPETVATTKEKLANKLYRCTVPRVLRNYIATNDEQTKILIQLWLQQKSETAMDEGIHNE